MKVKAPSERDVASELGGAQNVWDAIVSGLEEDFGPIVREWKPSKKSFGWMCLLKHKKRTLLYLTPEQGTIQVAVVLGERAAGLAFESELPEWIKAMIREARPYAEGRGIRFAVSSAADVSVMRELIALKTTTK